MPFEIDSEGARAEHQAPPEDPGAQTANSTERKDGWKDFIESAKAREFYQSNVKSLSAEETDELMCDILHVCAGSFQFCNELTLLMQSIDLDCETNGSVFSDDRRHLRRLLLKLARDKNHLPSSITLDGIIRDTATQDRGGSYADILCAKYGNQQVALKRMRGFHTASVKKTKVSGFSAYRPPALNSKLYTVVHKRGLNMASAAPSVHPALFRNLRHYGTRYMSRLALDDER